ncbi:hypothetical protein [Salisediminibacterium halotolerans]|uniref:hypothetical protein n=1 Tax=Salisediminibacterium halotolerans TaxID=517425 RepID=UPI000EB199E5|nr:hypothetical protein [Salisediminibacterium halotolerans]RLJ72232.1 hypothetical protein BCL39_2127 [Actinophytocola xinjiangensis]RPE85445.1 hypothetical protein EDD67_2262 [Salisediminibacterium halotolerans]TWG33402.1 hypothetical protein BCL52_2123 [Salisediminibacterium halotolerans]GEL07876.1 hypothetical protein SHA02_12920 [Salisediminibacterium halotolerans]
MRKNVSRRRLLIEDATRIQLRWSFWFVLIIVPIIALLTSEVLFPADLPDEMSFRSFLVEPGKVYMLIIGIIFPLAYFRFFIAQGVTRRIFYQANLTAALLVSAGLIVTLFMLTWLIQFLFGWTDAEFTAGAAPFAALPDLIPLQIGAAVVLFLQFYLIGWLIQTSFIQGGGWGGAASIVASLLILSISDSLWQEATIEPAVILLPTFDITLFPALEFSPSALTVVILQLFLTGLIGFVIWLLLRQIKLKTD